MEKVKNKSPTRKVGKPCKEYQDFVNSKVLENIKLWKKMGQTDDWVYKKIGIGKSLGIKWKKEYSEFGEVFKKGTEDLLLELEQTLYTRAVGFYATDEDETKEQKYNKDFDKFEEIVTKRVVKKKFIWSDPCLMKALTRLNPHKWSDDARHKDERIAMEKEKHSLSSKEKLIEHVANMNEGEIEQFLKVLSNEK